MPAPNQKPTPNQRTFKDSQEFKIDIDQIFTDFISNIDSIRSFVNITSPENSSKLNVLTDQSFVSLGGNLKSELTFQESRAHAFFRWIGFPVVDSSKDGFYNPGLDNISGEREINIDKKVDIANKPIDGFKTLSLKRETYYSQNIAGVFLNNTNIASSILALSSTSLRAFNDHIKKNTDPFDMDIKHQSYTIELIDTNKVPYSQYTDKNGDTVKINPLYGSDVKTRLHIITPFIVDARIDLSVNSSNRRICVPFPYDRSETCVSEQSYVKTCILEKVIKERFDVKNQQIDMGTADIKLMDYIKSFQSLNSIKDDSLIKKVSENNVFKNSQLEQFIKYFDIFRAMFKKLTLAQKEITRIQSNYYWIPIPSRRGPEGGCTTQNVFLKDPQNLQSSKDNKIKSTQSAFFIAQINAESSKPSSADPGNFTIPPQLQLSVDNSKGLLNLTKSNLDRLANARESELNRANKALQDIEVIMGEFSGLGLCDILVVLASLYTMDKKYLLGFLDEDAYNRCKSQMGFGDFFSPRPTISESMENLTKSVTDFYNLLEKLYENAKDENGIT